MNMNMERPICLELGETAFARRGARPILVWERGGLYLGLKPAGAALPFAQMFGGGGSPGIMRVTVWSDGAELPFALDASAFLTTLTTEKGSVRFAIDRAANALRIEGDVPMLRLSAGAAFGSNTARLPDGAETNLGGRIVYKVRRGKFEFDDTWLLSRWVNVDPCLTVTPEDGRFDVVCFDAPADTELREVTTTLDACAADAKADFEAFYRDLKPTDVLTAYRLWSETPKTGSVELAEESYLFADARAAFARVLGAAEAGKSGIVPKFGSAALRLIDDGLLGAIPPDEARRLLAALREALAWWRRYRFDEARGQYFYAYRAETGEENPPRFGEAPVYLPELQERLAQLTAAVAKLSQGEGTT